MAHTRTHHPIRLWTGKQVAESPLDRLVVLSWKGNKTTGREAHSARCISIPNWTPNLEGKDIAFVDLLIDAMEERQRLAAHAFVTESLGRGDMCNDIPAAMLDPDEMLKQFEIEQEEGDGKRGKISSAQIGAWFNDVLGPLVQHSVAVKQGWLADGYDMTEDNAKKLQQVANNYRATLEKLAAPKPSVDVNTGLALQKAMSLLESEDGISRKLMKKIDRIINPPVTEDIALDAL